MPAVRGLRLIAGLIFILSAAQSADGSTLTLLISGFPVNSTEELGGPLQQIIAAGWTDALARSEVSISVRVAASDPGSSMTAYLMNQIGPGTTAANEVASVTFIPGTTLVDRVLFSGMSLAPGSYFVVLTANSVDGQVWGATNGPINFLGIGWMVTSPFLGIANVAPNDPQGSPDPYAPASTFFDLSSGLRSSGVFINVTATETPEPSAVFLTSTGLLGLAAVGRRVRR